MKNISRIAVHTIAVAVLASAAWATDGMNIEGYGPIALSLGGASYAYDNGNAAVINNPATLSLAPPPGNRLDVAVGFLGPDVTASVPGGPEANSNEDAYFMPALGWSTRKGDLTYGFGVFAQGGMGTQYSSKSFLALNSGDGVRAEVSVGRFMLPLSYEVNDKLSVGGTVDFVWAGLDLKMAVPGAVAPGLVTGGTLPLPALAGSDFVRIDFSDDEQFSGDARGYGAAGKVGLVYTPHEKISIGAVYHSKTALEDLETSGAELSIGSSLTGVRSQTLKGDVTIRDFEWPETYGAGIAFQATERLLLVADVKHILWSDVMEDFKLTFDARGGFGSVDLTLPQNWDDQVVYAVGAAFKVNDQWTVRAGYNKTENPIPDEFVNPLFPAIVEDHITAGFGYSPDGVHAVHFAGVYVPETEVTNADGIRIEHSQVSAQLMYSYSY
jgi:long-chain fatty acid transport protein